MIVYVDGLDPDAKYILTNSIPNKQFDKEF